MDGISHIGVLLVPLAAPGLALLAAVRLIYGARRQQPDIAQTMLFVSGCLLTLLAFVGALFSLAGIIALIVLLFVVGVAMTAAGRHNQAERRALLSILAVAAKRGIPLPEAVRAFGADQSARRGWRADLLAEGLQAGMPLSAALRRSRNRLPFSAQFAVHMSERHSDLARSLSCAADEMDQLDDVLLPKLERLMTLMLSMTAALSLMLYVIGMIVPVWMRMFGEFELDLPPLTNAVGRVSNALSDHLIIVIPLYGVLIATVAYVWLAGVGLLPRTWPIINRLWRKADAAGVLRMLKLAVETGRPLDEVLSEMAECHPGRHFRRLLRRAHAKIMKGAPWCDALLAVRLIRPADAAVLRSAERAGNLAWALDEVANRMLRQAGYRLNAVYGVGMTAAVVVFGALVGVYAIAMFEPLTKLVEALA